MTTESVSAPSSSPAVDRSGSVATSSPSRSTADRCSTTPSRACGRSRPRSLSSPRSGRSCAADGVYVSCGTPSASGVRSPGSSSDSAPRASRSSSWSAATCPRWSMRSSSRWSRRSSCPRPRPSCSRATAQAAPADGRSTFGGHGRRGAARRDRRASPRRAHRRSRHLDHRRTHLARPRPRRGDPARHRHALPTSSDGARAHACIREGGPAHRALPAASPLFGRPRQKRLQEGRSSSTRTPEEAISGSTGTIAGVADQPGDSSRRPTGSGRPDWHRASSSLSPMRTRAPAPAARRRRGPRPWRPPRRVGCPRSTALRSAQRDDTLRSFRLVRNDPKIVNARPADRCRHLAVVPLG